MATDNTSEPDGTDAYGVAMMILTGCIGAKQAPSWRERMDVGQLAATLALADAVHDLHTCLARDGHLPAPPDDPAVASSLPVPPDGPTR